jgi:hypothetical protein
MLKCGNAEMRTPVESCFAGSPGDIQRGENTGFWILDSGWSEAEIPQKAGLDNGIMEYGQG